MTEIHLSTGPPHFLLVDDDDLVAAAYRRPLGRFGVVTVASNVAEANVVVDTMALTGIVADISLPDGTGLEVASRALARTPGLPILLMSGTVDHDRLNAAHDIGASYLLKPIDVGRLMQFADRAVGRQRRATTLLDEWVRRYRLTPAEAVTLRLALSGMGRNDIARTRGVSRVTVRNQASSLVAKLSTRTLPECVSAFYRELWAGDR